MTRVAQLMRRYRDFPHGLTDASVLALAERTKVDRIATVDHRHFRAVTPAHTTALTLVP